MKMYSLEVMSALGAVLVFVFAIPMLWERVPKVGIGSDAKNSQSLKEVMSAQSLRLLVGQQPEEEQSIEVQSEMKIDAKEIITVDAYFAELPEEVAVLSTTLRSLQLTAVRAFESMPSFGANRASFSSPSYSDLKLPARHLPSLFEVPYERTQLHIRVRNTGNVNAINGYQAWSWLYAMHRITSRGFVYKETDLELERSDTKNKEQDTDVNLIVGIPADSGRLDFKLGRLSLDAAAPLEQGDRLWKLHRFELISLLKHDPPVAYEKNPDTFRDFLGHVTTRPLDGIELRSLQRLQAGEDRVIAWNADNEQLHMVGAIRAKKVCLTCHERAKHDGLLGAFTYLIQEAPE